MPKRSLTEQAWDRHSEDYQARHKIPTRYIHYGPYCPTEDDLQLLGEVEGKDLVELGCGGGQNSVAFAKSGAHVIGVDVSERQLAHAKRIASKEGVDIEFLKADVQHLAVIPSGSQDIAFSAYALQYVRDLRECFNEVYRILKSGGIFVFSLDHPFHWCFSQRMSKLRVVRSYFNEKSMLGNLGRVYPRSVSHIFNELFDSGFIIANILEPQPVKGDTESDLWPEYRPDHLSLMPATIIFKALKPHGFADLLGAKTKRNS